MTSRKQSTPCSDVYLFKDGLRQSERLLRQPQSLRLSAHASGIQPFPCDKCPHLCLAEHPTRSSMLYQEGNRLVTDTVHCGSTQFMRRLRTFLCAVISTRVLFPHEVAKCSQLRLILDCFKEDNPQCFQHNLRVSPCTLDVLVSLIQDHPTFYNTSGNEQLPVSYQLAITLYCFRHYGNVASVESVAQSGQCQ